VRRPLSVARCSFLLIAASIAVAQTPLPSHPAGSSAAAVPEINTIVDRMGQAQIETHAHSQAYTVTREYRLYAADPQQPSSEVVAQVSFVPPDKKTFDIKQASGSSRGEKIVKNVLEAEAKTAHSDRNALTRANYDFEYQGEQTLDGRRCYVLQLIPKRHEDNLVKGRAWIDAETYLVHRVQGDLAKSPSWWLKSVNVTLDFSAVAGMWLQTATKALAEVRIFGHHTLESHALNVQTAPSVARAAAPRRLVPARPTRRTAVTGEVVFIPR
jgi:outer membrane lipoprotein-sorting protein